MTEPSGLKASILTNRLMPGGASLLILTTGVLPTVSRMLAYLCPMELSPPERLSKITLFDYLFDLGARSQGKRCGISASGLN